MQSEKAPYTIQYESAIQSDEDESLPMNLIILRKAKKRESTGSVPSNEKMQEVEVSY